MQTNYWSQTMIRALKKYLGWDWRIVPLAGVIVSVVTAILLNIPLSDKFLFGYPILLILMIAYALAAHDKWIDDTKRLIPVEQLLNSRKEKIKDFVFPYMRDINAYRVIRGLDNVVNLSVYFPSLLLDEVELKLKCRLLVESRSCPPVSIGKIRLYRDAIYNASFEYPIIENKVVVELIKESAKQYKPISVRLEIWDEDNEQIRWLTPDWSVLPFA